MRGNASDAIKTSDITSLFSAVAKRRLADGDRYGAWLATLGRYAVTVHRAPSRAPRAPRRAA